MSLVMIHIGNIIPEYVPDTMEQVRKFYDGDLYFVKSKDCSFENKHNAIIVDYELLADYDKVREYKKVNTLQGFWGVTCERFFILEALISKYNLTSVFHIENDVTIYVDPQELVPFLSTFCKDSIVINPTGPEISTGAFVYVDNLDAISFVNNKFLEMLKNPKSVLDRLTEKFLSEMKFLNLVAIDYPARVKKFCALPTNGDSLIFDCATWGQLLGGTPNGYVTAKELQHHWIGKEMYPERKYDFMWELDDKGRNCLFIVDKHRNKYRVNNLHVHCKRIREFMA